MKAEGGDPCGHGYSTTPAQLRASSPPSARPPGVYPTANIRSSSVRWIKIASALYAFLLYVNTVEYGFVYDDHRAILTNDDLLPSTPITALLEHDFWGRPIWHAGSHKSYRPLAVLSLRLNDALAGGTLKPGPLHLGNAVLHGLVTALLTHLAALLLLGDGVGVNPSSNSHRSKRREDRGRNVKSSTIPLVGNGSLVLGSDRPETCSPMPRRRSRDPGSSNSSTPTHKRRSRESSSSSTSSIEDLQGRSLTNSDEGFCSAMGVIFAGFLFACHPVHTEAVCGLVGRADIAASLFSLLALLSYRCHAIQRDSSHSSDNLCNPTVVSASYLGLSVLFGVAAMLSKEHGLAALPLCVAYDALVHCRCRPVARLLWKCLCLPKTSSVSLMHLTSQHSKSMPPLDSSPKKTYHKSESSGGHADRGFYQSLIFIGIATSSLLVIRCAALAGGLPSFSSADNPASRSNSTLVRSLTFFYLPVLNLNLLICPITLSFDWSMDAVPLVKSIADKRNIASILLYVGFMYLMFKMIQSAIPLPSFKECLRLWRHKSNSTQKKQNGYLPVQSFKVHTNSSVSLFAMSLIILPFLPATNLIAYVGFVIAERVLYAPSMGYCLLLGIGLSHLLKASAVLPYKCWGHALKFTIICSAILLVIVFTARTIIRSKDWRDEESLYGSGISINPAKAYGNLGNVLSNRGKIAEAEAAYREALLHRPNMADAHFNLGLLLQNKGELEESIECYKRAVQFRPSLAVAHLNMGLTLVRLGKWDEGIERLRLLAERGGARVGDASLLKDPRAHEVALASARFHLGRLLAQRGQLPEALETLQDALKRMPPNYSPQSLLNMLGEVYRQMGQEHVAEEWFRASLQSKPDHIPAHLTYARLLADNKTRHSEAEKQYLKALHIAPRDASALHQYGRFLVEQGRHSEAAKYFETASEVMDPPQFEDVMAAATSYRLSGDLARAEVFYRKGVQLRPQLHSAHVNLGALLHLTGRLEDAKKSYEMALTLKPGDQLTMTNLQRLQATKSSQISSLSKNNSKEISSSNNGVG